MIESGSSRGAPPLSPVLLAGLVAGPLPPALLQPWLAAAMRLLKMRHPDVFERLHELEDTRFLIDPVDLRLVLLLDARPDHPRLVALGERDARPEAVAATIRGPLAALVDLLEGRIDGDALFFSRQLSVEGDTEAVVALRNAVDAAEIDLVGDVLSVLGPARKPVSHLLGLAGGLYRRFAQDMEVLQSAVLAPALKRAEAQAAMLKRLDDRVSAQTRTAARPRRTPT